jgi:molecular chaperone GrpE
MTTDETRGGATGEAQPGPDPRAANDDLGNLREGDGQAAAAAARSPEEEAAELRDRLLRTLAEMENLRARTAREVEEARKYAVTGFARDLLDAADNLRRALASVPAEGREAAGAGGGDLLRNLLLGVEMTEKTLLGAFEKHRIRRVEPQRGDRFDPNLHQAMFEVPTDAQAPGTVAEVVQAGYVIADRLLRPALVGVAKAGAQAAPQRQAGAGVGTTA